MKKNRNQIDEEVTILYRPVGEKELSLIRAGGFRSFPARLPEQPFFYPVLNEAYATKIARDWNTRYNPERCGYVTRFAVSMAFLTRYEVHIVGGFEHQEYWIPSEDLEEFNQWIVGRIEVVAEYRAPELGPPANQIDGE